MDPITLMTGVTAAYKGIQNAIAAGREVEDVFNKLRGWADAAGKMQEFINKAKDPNYKSKPGIFETIGFDRSETAEAMDLYAYQQKLREMEEEIRHMFYYGALQHLGQEGYREFIQLRKKVREDREQMVLEQARRRAKFLENAFYATMIALLIYVLFEAFVIFFNYGRSTGKW